MYGSSSAQPLPNTKPATMDPMLINMLHKARTPTPPLPSPPPSAASSSSASSHRYSFSRSSTHSIDALISKLAITTPHASPPPPPPPQASPAASTASASCSSLHPLQESKECMDSPDSASRVSLPRLSEDETMMMARRDVEYLKSSISSHDDRRQALTRLLALCTTPDCLSTAADLPSLLMKPILAYALTDTAEPCRHLACAITTALITACTLTSLSAQLRYLMPALAFRLHTHDLTTAITPQHNATNKFTCPMLATGQWERSEHIRLELLTIATLTVHRYVQEKQRIEAHHHVHSRMKEVAAAAEAAAAHALLSGGEQEQSSCVVYADALTTMIDETVTLVAQCLLDPYMAVASQACTLLCTLAAHYSTYLRHSSSTFARLLLPLTQHRHYRLRVASLSALQAIIPLGASELIRDACGFVEHNVIDIHGFYHGESRVNYIAACATDSHASVRAALYTCVSAWMIDMKQSADYETLLMPYVYSGLADDCPAAADICYQAVCALGQRYEHDFADELADELMYGEEAEATVTRAHMAGCAFLTVTHLPFTKRAPLGVRLYARKFLDRLLHAIVTELADWHMKVQQQSVRLLRTLLFFAEEHVTPHATSLLRVLVQRAHHSQQQHEDEQEHSVVVEVRECMQLIARYVSIDVWLSALTDCADEQHHANVRHHRLCVYSVLAQMLPAVPPLVISARCMQQMLEVIDVKARGGSEAVWRAQVAVLQALASVQWPNQAAKTACREPLTAALHVLRACIDGDRRVLKETERLALTQQVDALIERDTP